jgi:hypothetical protein
VDDTLVKIGIALASALLGSGGLWAVIQRRTPDASQQQISQDAFYARLDERERLAQQELRERDRYWYAELQKVHEQYRQQHAQDEQEHDALERRCVLCEAREQGYKDKIDSLHSTIQQLTTQIERLQQGRA